MTVSVQASGTFSPGATSSSFTTLTAAPETTAGAFQILVDCNAMVAGDAFDVQLIEKVLSGGTARVVWRASISGAQAQPILASPTVMCAIGWDMQARQTAGTVRSFPWSVRKAA